MEENKIKIYSDLTSLYLIKNDDESARFII